MSKPSSILIGPTFLGILILISLIPFNLTPSLAAPATEVLGRRRNLRDESGIVSLPEERSHTLPKASILVKRSFDQQITVARSPNPIGAQSATFVVNYNPVGNCVVAPSSGLPNFIPDIVLTAWPSGAQAAFEHALSIWSTVLDANQTIVINACWAVRPTAGILGTGQPVSAFSNFMGAPITDTLYVAALANELTGSDLNDNNDGNADHDSDGQPVDAEITMSFNGHANIDWYFGTDANPGPGEVDFVTAALHEFAHGLGFVSTMNVDTGNNACLTSTSGDGCWGVGFPGGFPAIFDRFLENEAGTNLIQNFTNQSAALGTALTTANVRFNGPNAMLADSGKPRLFSPGPFELGSSILHLNQSTYQNTFNRLMTPTTGDPQHHPGPVTLGILKDIGWEIIDLPPATLSKSTSATSIQGGQALTYTLTVTNTGHFLMTDVTITDTVPPGTTLDTASLSGDASFSGIMPGSRITWTTGVSLSTINTLSRTFAVTVDLEVDVSTITNTAFVTSSAGVGANDTVVITVGNGNVYLPIILSN